MTTDPALLLHQWLSPSFPVGAFSYSHGLEQAVAEGAIHDAASAQDWIRTALEHGAGLSDAILLAAAWRRGGGALDELTELARAFAPSAERLAEADRMGAALASALRALHGHDLPDAPYPVVLGRAAMGETVGRLHLRDRREILRAGRPVHVEPLALDEDALRAGAAVLDGARAMASLVMVAPGVADALGPARTALGTEGVRAGASVVDGRLVVRMLAADGWPLRRQVLRLLAALRRGPPPRVWQG